MKHRAEQRGITKVELTLGGAVLGVVVMGASWLLSFDKETVQVDRAVANAQTVFDAAASWQGANSESGGCPTLSQLQHERYLDDQDAMEDPWGSRLRIQCDEDSLTVVSAGPDGSLGTSDDVRVPRGPNRS